MPPRKSPPPESPPPESPAPPSNPALPGHPAEAIGGGRAVPEAPKQKMDAFDLWLQRGLHQLYDDVANEPLPEDLLRLIEEDRTK